MSKNQRIFFKTDVVKSYYTNFIKIFSGSNIFVKKEQKLSNLNKVIFSMYIYFGIDAWPIAL